MTAQHPRDRRDPHWVVPVVVSALLSVLLGSVIAWLGLNDWRVPWMARGSAAERAGEEHVGGATAPIKIKLLENGGVDVEWSIVDDPALHGYSLYVSAVRPIDFTYSVPRYDGDRDVTERLYPARRLNELLTEDGDPRRVRSGQVWHVCVQGMKETPLYEPIDEYIIPGTRACSDDFTLG